MIARDGRTHPRAGTLRLRLGLGAALVLLVLAVFARVRGFDFPHFDDQTYVAKNPDVVSGLTAHSVAWAFTTGRVPGRAARSPGRRKTLS